MIGQVDLERPTTNGRTETTIKEVLPRSWFPMAL